MQWPNPSLVQKQLYILNKELDGPVDVRLQVYPDGQWIVRFGDPGYDDDHHGYWGAASLRGKGRDAGTLRGIAEDLISQCQESYSEEECA